ncbi:hypothetical protein MCOR27_009275 [Pyricularia oryzae]|uniref:Uncharacterized protein n=1 Tax=Pyricularia grisea TaxID=148305 RepID=A0ABQ8NM34_PYRGI|nr:hypothetical protein MCOR02_012194 [Pyricularia oryzae]KAI6299218.1 hypothetical protein MCOR33_004867 [Pyricularia grisea]KAI6260716.1 hypothetical protein MCOR19_003064 [Pyricularia oryzae]KAI6270450.1 hypothetical protein MCOR27_009275 [Pyricularia oryzae]KAI6276197.1 hypothetical protein MCOR26_005754 [Pyricularia oryzae]
MDIGNWSRLWNLGLERSDYRLVAGDGQSLVEEVETLRDKVSRVPIRHSLARKAKHISSGASHLTGMRVWTWRSRRVRHRQKLWGGAEHITRKRKRRGRIVPDKARGKDGSFGLNRFD